MPQLLHLPKPLYWYGDDTVLWHERSSYRVRQRNFLKVFAGENKEKRQMADGEKQKRVRERGEEVTNELPEQWKPEIGDELNGFYRGFKTIHPSTAAKPFKIHFFEPDEDGAEVMSCSGTILDRKMARIPRDAFVFLTYEGMTRVGKGHAHNYKVQPQKGVQLLPETMDSDAAQRAD